MDRTELINKLQTFRQQCDIEGYGIKGICLEDAYPGIRPTSFIVKVIAKDWLHSMDCYDALKKLIAILWETTEAKTRENIFTIAIYDESESLHCLDWDENKDKEVLSRLVEPMKELMS